MVNLRRVLRWIFYSVLGIFVVPFLVKTGILFYQCPCPDGRWALVKETFFGHSLSYQLGVNAQPQSYLHPQCPVGCDMTTGQLMDAFWPERPLDFDPARLSTVPENPAMFAETLKDLKNVWNGMYGEEFQKQPHKSYLKEQFKEFYAAYRKFSKDITAKKFDTFGEFI